MSPEAYDLAILRIKLEVREATRKFARTVGAQHEEFTSRGVGTSSMMIIAVHDLARAEFEERALGAWLIVQRLLDADDSPPSEESRGQAVDLARRAIYDLSSDVDDVYKKHCGRLKGMWPALEEPRECAAAVVESEIGTDFLARQRKRIPLDDVLRVPRYEVPLTHWRNAKELAERSDPDLPNAVKEATLALESLAKTVLPGHCATLGECIKLLRSRQLLDPGVDKILEGIWSYSNAIPGVRHGGTSVSALRERGWYVIRPMLERSLDPPANGRRKGCRVTGT